MSEVVETGVLFQFQVSGVLIQIYSPPKIYLLVQSPCQDLFGQYRDMLYKRYIGYPIYDMLEVRLIVKLFQR